MLAVFISFTLHVLLPALVRVRRFQINIFAEKQTIWICMHLKNEHHHFRFDNRFVDLYERNFASKATTNVTRIE